MDNSMEKMRKTVNSLQVNQRLFREIINQMNEPMIKNQFELIIEENERLIIELRNTIREEFSNNDSNNNNNNNSSKFDLNKGLVPNDSEKSLKTYETRVEQSFNQQIVETNEILVNNNNSSNGLVKKKLYCCQWPGCGYETVIAGNVSKHLCVHSGEKRYVCDWPQCGKRYQQSGGLMAHKRSHLGLKPFACDWIGCNYRTNNRCSLPAHKLIHKGVKPFVCDWPQCRISCATITHLRAHKLTHSGEKPFKCDVCEQTFAKVCNMKSHRLSVHEGVKRIRKKQ